MLPHRQNILRGDALGSMRRMNSRSVHLVFMHPPGPFLQKISVSNQNLYKDHWFMEWEKISFHFQRLQRDHPKIYRVCRMARKIHGEGSMNWAVWISICILEAKRVLSECGDACNFWFCCPTGFDYLCKILLSAIFGKEACLREITVLANVDEAENIPASVWLGIGKAPPECRMQPLFSGKKIWFWEPEEDELKREYALEQPVALAKEIITKSTLGKESVVLETFGGTGFACMAAESLGRCWIYCETSRQAVDVFTKRIEDGRNLHIYHGKISRNDEFSKKKFPDETFCLLYARQEGRCPGCGFHLPPALLTIDHQVPQAVDGGSWIDNALLLCQACNGKKGDIPLKEDREESPED